MPSDKEERLRKLIKKHVQKALDEASTTGGVAGYLTPNAFVGPNADKNKRDVEKLAKQIGYSLTKRGAKEISNPDPIKESVSQDGSADLMTENKYIDFLSQEGSSLQKIGRSIREVNRQIKEIDDIVKMSHRLQKETSISGDQLWRRTRAQLVKLESRLIKLAGKIRDMRN